MSFKKIGEILLTVLLVLTELAVLANIVEQHFPWIKGLLGTLSIWVA